MKIVFVSAWYSEKMGYAENCLPKALAQLGHEVHVVTSQAQVYYNQPFFKTAYEHYLGSPIQPVGTKTIDGVVVHRLPFKNYGQKIVIQGLTKTMRALKPDVVHTFEHVAIDTLKLAALKWVLGFKLFTANHAVLSVYPIAKNWDNLSFSDKLKWVFTEDLVGRIVNLATTKCFCVTTDAAEVAVRFRGVSRRKAKVTTLGVDTDLFTPNSEQKEALREQLDIDPEAVLCVYSGKLIEQKQPELLAQAVEILNQNGLKFTALFIGEGPLKEKMLTYPHTRVLPLQPLHDLPPFYQMADIGVWPGEESSSQLDCVGSGACLVLTDNIVAYDRIEDKDSVSLVYKPHIVSRHFQHGQVEALALALASLADAQVRLPLQEAGVREIQSKYSWHAIAKERLLDYEGKTGF